MTLSNDAKTILKEAIVIDGQLGFEMAMPWTFAEKWALVDRYKNAGFHALTLSIANEENTTEETLRYLAKIRNHIFQHPEKYMLAKTEKDILRAKNEDKIALRIMFQGTGPIGKDLNLLESFYELGVSSLVIAYNIRTPMGDGVIEEGEGGLSHLGKKLIREMNRLGMIIDGAHTGLRTMMDAIKLTTRPLVISHSGVYGVNSHVRNVKDEQIKAIAKTGGIVGINGISVLLGAKDNLLEKYVEHIDYVVNLVGIDHVAIGLDNLYFKDQFAEFMQNQQITHPESYAAKAGNRSDWNCVQPEALESIVKLLIARHYTVNEVGQILGGNILKVL